MRTVLVTGSSGFIGKNLLEALGRREDVRILTFDLPDTPDLLERHLAEADVIYHLAGVNRPLREEEYETGNAGLTEQIAGLLRRLQRRPLVVLSSSTQAELDNPYGRSKRKAEEALLDLSRETGTPVRVFRLPGVFGKWCRPNYNSVVATFCHNIAHNLPITISDPAKQLDLVYIDDVVKAMTTLLETRSVGGEYAQVTPIYAVTLGRLAEIVRSFPAMRSTLRVPDMQDRLVFSLYGTYLTYLDTRDFAYTLERKADDRGSLAELLKSAAFGQIFVSRTKPGIARGNHYHHTKTEKFCVLEGEALIRFRHIFGSEIIDYRVSGENFVVVDIPPGYTHSIENVGAGELVTLFWASEPFDPTSPDTYSMKVVDEKA